MINTKVRGTKWPDSKTSYTASYQDKRGIGKKMDTQTTGTDYNPKINPHNIKYTDIYKSAEILNRERIFSVNGARTIRHLHPHANKWISTFNDTTPCAKIDQKFNVKYEIINFRRKSLWLWVKQIFCRCTSKAWLKKFLINWTWSKFKTSALQRQTWERVGEHIYKSHIWQRTYTPNISRTLNNGQ